MKKTYYLPTHHIVGLIILQFSLIIKPWRDIYFRFPFRQRVGVSRRIVSSYSFVTLYATIAWRGIHVNYNLISVLNCISCLVTKKLWPSSFRFVLWKLGKRNTCRVPKSADEIRNLNTLSGTTARCSVRKCVKHASKQCQGVKILSTHTTHTTRVEEEDAMRRWPQKIFYLVFNFGVFVIFIFCGAQIAFEIDWLSSLSHILFK